ncbi:MAG: peptidase C13 family protein [Moraxellaceae bacterium]|jgi:hypothetical protein|nr:peptidase C13 family protein [Moraxellaceae bacterium]HQX89184.1 C13 family peptidase [Moraxellaceae bacterium]
MRWTLTGPPLLSDLFRNLWAACHLLVFRRSALRWLAPSPSNFLILLMLSLTVSFTFDLLSEGWPGQWSPAGIAVYLLPGFALLVFGQVLVSRHGLWRLGLAPASIGLAADSLMGIAQCILLYAGQHEWLSADITRYVPEIYLLLYLWPVLALVLVFTRALAWPRLESVLAFIILMGFFIAWTLLFSDERLWTAVTTEEPAPVAPHIIEEAAVYAQPDLLQRALAALEPERPEQVDWYFLGVGGAAYQGVFRTEAETAKALFDTRFATSGRSLILLNNDDTAYSQPIATRTSIARALSAFSSRMNRDQDVLFLFLTSHGSEAHEIELSYWPLQLAPVTPSWLRQVLDDSGIKRRVIVLSACYSGGFIKDIQTPDTLIITAAAADKPSFGCTDDADLTYFGRAFFDEALRREYSLRASYEQSLSTLQEREEALGYGQSNPQWVIGEQLAKDLPSLEKSLFPPSR